MFGYVTVQQPELKIREFETYRAYYCGLCRALRRRYGLAGQATLSYDMTFLAMLLGGLYEPESTEGTTVCLLHPGVKHPTVTDPYVEYAAHMNILLSYYDLEDDWKDEKKLGGKFGADLLRKKAEGLAEYYPRQAQAVKDYVASLSELEKTGGGSLDDAAGLTGRMLGEVFTPNEDIWAPYLRNLGFYLGKFIYLMDAYDDLEKDRDRKAYNPWLAYGETRPAVETKAREILNMMMGECCRAFEHLPILRHEAILRNILYAGVWGRFEKIAEEEAEKAKKAAEKAAKAAGPSPEEAPGAGGEESR